MTGVGPTLGPRRCRVRRPQRTATRTGSRPQRSTGPRTVWADAGSEEDLHRRMDRSVVFVDISGFTKMSERLARFGNVGAEHVTEVIGSRFSRLLASTSTTARRSSSSVATRCFLFFSGDAHSHGARPRRPTRCATRCARSRPFATEAGTVTLRMTVGVHSGPFDFFLVGGSHRELIVAGPTASTAGSRSKARPAPVRSSSGRRRPRRSRPRTWGPPPVRAPRYGARSPSFGPAPLCSAPSTAICDHSCPPRSGRCWAAPRGDRSTAG